MTGQPTWFRASEDAIGRAHENELRRELSRREKAADTAVDAFMFLRNEFEAAIREDPARVIQTPGYSQHEMSAADTMLDLFSGSSGDRALYDLLSMVGAASRGANIELLARNWIANRAAEHAAFHRDDWANRSEG